MSELGVVMPEPVVRSIGVVMPELGVVMPEPEQRAWLREQSHLER